MLSGLVSLLISCSHLPIIDIPESGSSSLQTNQNMIETLSGFDHIDFDNQDGMFEAVLAGLNDEITVYPSEGYYYFWFYHHGNLVRGNIRFGYDLLEEGKLAFAYYYDMAHSPGNKTYTKFKIFEPSNDFSLTRTSEEQSYILQYKNKTIRATLPIPVSTYTKRDGEIHIGDMTDESGIVFSLIFNEAANHFFYILDRSADYELHEDLSDAISIGARSSFVFYNRDEDKILVGVRADKVKANTFYDGPFDQLPEHSLEAANFKKLVKKAYPQLSVEINGHGQFEDSDNLRVAIDNYVVYNSLTQFAPLQSCQNSAPQDQCVQEFLDSN